MLNQKGVTHLALIFILLAGIVAGVYLVQRTQVFKPKATSDSIELVTSDGNDPDNCIVNKGGNIVVTCPKVKVKLTPPNIIPKTLEVGGEVSLPFYVRYYSCDPNERHQYVGREAFFAITYKEEHYICPDNAPICEQIPHTGIIKCVPENPLLESPDGKIFASIGLAENPTATKDFYPYELDNTGSVVIPYEFKDQTEGVHFIYAEYINNGKTYQLDPYPIQITIENPASTPMPTDNLNSTDEATPRSDSF